MSPRLSSSLSDAAPRLAPGRLLLALLPPLTAAAIAWLAILVTTTPADVDGLGGPWALARDLVELCCLILALDSAARGLCDLGIGEAGDADRWLGLPRRTGAASVAERFWRQFPNHFDVAACALGMVALLGLI